MPMTRYELRNEFALADPELYRAADKDDPEALLEGVAMAGLVGVLRQLGDLAEFAAEIFHDLHEEVMSTSARGHSLMTRVQQLEADFPLIEKAFLLQTDHSSFPYNTGVDWHPNLRMDQNLVTQGDLPRFIMDSYEECRPPPRLFLLDKYDVAGAGACLTRYTDPSFFKIEISSFGVSIADVQRKRKVLKAKKKGSRWRNGDKTPEVVTSHVKLDQLFMKESIENGVTNPARRVKLKRRLNGFPSGSKTWKSCMEKLLKITSIDDKVLQEVSTKFLTLPTNSLNDSDLEIVSGGLMSPDRESKERKKSPTSSHIQDIILKPSIYKPNEVFVYDKIFEPPNSSPDVVAEDNAFNHDKVTSDEDMTADVEGGFASYQPEDISSEMENYVDAPSTMESEMDTDSELMVKSDYTSSFINAQQLVSDSNEETSDSNEKQASAHSSDSHSTGNSTESNDGDISSRKELPAFSSSGSPRSLTENQQSECEVSDAILPFADIIDILPCHKTYQEGIPLSLLSKSAIYNYTCNGTATITGHESDLDQLTSCLTSADSTPTLVHSDLECVYKGRSESHESSPLDQDERRASIVLDLPCSPSVSEMHSGYNSPRFSGEDHLLDESDDESVPCLSTFSDRSCHTTDSAVLLSTNFLQDHNNSNTEDPNKGKNDTSTSNICDGCPLERYDSLHMISNLISNKLDGGIPEKTENSVTKYPDADHTGDSFTATSEGEKLIDELGNGDSVAFSDIACILEASLGKKFEGTSATSAQNAGSEGSSSTSSADKQLGSENLILLHIEDCHDLHGTALDVQDRDGVIPVEQRTTETPAFGMPQFCEVELLRTEITGDHVFPGDSAFVESSCCPLQNLETSAGTSDFVEGSKVTPSTISGDLEVGEISRSPDPDPASLNKVHVQLDATDGQMQQSETTISVSSVADDKDEVGLFMDHNHGELDLVEIAGQREAAASVSNIVVSDNMNSDKIKLEIPDTVPKLYIWFEDEHDLDSDNTASTVKPSLQHNDFSTAQESRQQFGLGNHPADAHSLSSGSHKEKIVLPPNQLDEELLGSDEINSDPLSLLPINHQQTLDHDERRGHENSLSMLSLENRPSPPFVPNLPAQSNHAIDGSGLLKDSLSLPLTSRYPFSETNHIDLEELPPLPPLPPVQWRMGKRQLASCASDGEMRKHVQLSSLGIFRPSISNDYADSSHEELNQSLNQIDQDMTTKQEREHRSSSLVAIKLHHSSCVCDGKAMKNGGLSSLGFSPPTTSKDDSTSSYAELNQSLNEINQDMTTKEEKSEPSSCSLVAKKLQHSSCVSDGEAMKNGGLSSLGFSPPTTSKDDASSSYAELNQSLNDSDQELTTKEEKSEHSSSSLVPIKLQHSSCVSDGEAMKNGGLSSLGFSPPTTSKDDASSSYAELNQSLNQINQDMTTKDEMSEHRSSSLVASCPSDGEMMKNGALSLLGISPPTTAEKDASSSYAELNQSLNQIKQDMTTKKEERERSSSSLVASCPSDGEIMKNGELSLLGISPPTTTEDDASSSYAELNQSLNQINQDMTTKKEKECISSSLVASCPSDGEMMKNGELSLLRITPPTTAEDDASSSYAELNQSLNQINQDMTTKKEKRERSSSSLVASCSTDGETMKHGELSSLGISPSPTSKHDGSSSCGELNQSLNQINQDMTTKEEKGEHRSSGAVAGEFQHASCSFDVETLEHGNLSSLGISQSTTLKNDTSYSLEELNRSLNPINEEMTTKEEKFEHSSCSFVSSIVMPEIDRQAKMENEEQQLVMPSSEGGSTSLAGEDFSHEGQTVKLPRPRNPLMDAVTAVDRSKLRKVTGRVRQEIHKVDERDSILEQIRTKSFNLKPALASRPSIRAPKTNLRVAAILEKANSIRQALVDSDEDEDNWSDS